MEFYLKTIKEQIKEYNEWVLKIKWETTRYDIINYFIKKNNYKRYLEIGVRDGECFKNININYKDSVDPVKGPYTTFAMTSDDFFLKLKGNFKYDIIFIDGLHLDYQVYNDIINSLKHLETNGTIICHDINPPFEICQRKEIIVPSWNGNSWKAFVKLRSEREDLEMYTIDTDWGLGIIKRGKQDTIKISGELYYALLEKNRKLLLNLITLEEFYLREQ